jgi:hypothetical protein
MLINGEWVRAASGKTFESRNPATGDLLATVAEAAACGRYQNLIGTLGEWYSCTDKSPCRRSI